MVKKRTHRLRAFLSDVSRPRTAEDYRRVLAPAPGEQRSGAPWLWLRLFLLNGAIFVFSLLIFLFFGGPRAHIVLIGAALFALPFLVFVYEACPGCGFPLWELLVLALAGGSTAGSLCFVYGLFDIKNELLSTLPVGFFEELFKALIAVAWLLIRKKETPADGLLAGSAVGFGFGFVESVSYIYIPPEGFTLFNTPAPRLLADSFMRSLYQPFAHIFWTALICCAFCAIERQTWKPSLIAAFPASVILHTVWDLTAPDALTGAFRTAWLGSTVFHWVILGVDFLLAGIFWYKAISVWHTEPRLPDPWTAPEEETPTLTFRQKRQLVRMTSILLLIVICGLYVLLHQATHDVTVSFGTADSFVTAMQGGMTAHPDLTRPYDPSVEDYRAVYLQGKKVSADQLIPIGDGGYFLYCYNLYEDPPFMTDFKYAKDTVDYDGSPDITITRSELVTAPGMRRYFYWAPDALIEGEDYILYFPLNRSALPDEYEELTEFDFYLYDGSVYADVPEVAGFLYGTSDRVLSICAIAVFNAWWCLCAVLWTDERIAAAQARTADDTDGSSGQP
ncbi:MAG: PrsW family intramembrane metalloprotease [Clostridia bacterium]|nr:PrsW family intramembrane metalloprotease [Clostridia bacterium]